MLALSVEKDMAAVYTLALNNAVVLTDVDYNEGEEMVSLRKDVTGVDNMVFVSPRACSQHADRIEVAIHPPQSSKPPSAKTAPMTIDDCGICGAAVSRELVEQPKRFIERHAGIAGSTRRRHSIVCKRLDWVGPLF